MRLDHFLKERIPKLTRERIQEAIATRVRVEPGPRRVRPALTLQPGDLVLVTRPTCPDALFDFEAPILYEDDDLLAVAKPPGVPVHATAAVIKNHLIAWLRVGRGSEVALAHRLDQETSGVVVATKTKHAARVLGRAFAAGAVSKEYLAIVFGRPEREFSIDLAVGRDPLSAIYIKQGAGVAGGQAASTRFTLEQDLGAYALVRARPLTGRRHQIRVHLAAAGHPVVGDKLYARGERHFLNFIARGTSVAMSEALGADRQLLHAARLSLRHPVSEVLLTLEAPLPDDMRDFIARNQTEDHHGV